MIHYVAERRLVGRSLRVFLLVSFMGTSIGLGNRALWAAPAVDQFHQVTQSFGGLNVGTSGSTALQVAQTFTVGLEGLLAEIGVELARDSGALGDIGLEIRSLSGGAPGSSVLASGTIPIASVPVQGPNSNTPFTFVDISSENLMVSPGDELAIVLSRVGPFNPGVSWVYGNPGYEEGAPYDRFGNNAWSAIAPTLGIDFGFQTLIDTNPSNDQTISLIPTFDVQADSSGGGPFSISDGDNTLEQLRSSSREARTLLEFPIDAIPNNATITGVSLSTQVNLFASGGGQSSQINFEGYLGNGIAEPSDASAATTFLGTTGPITEAGRKETSLTVNLLQSALASTDHLGIVASGGLFGFQSGFESSELAAILQEPERAPTLSVSFTNPPPLPKTPGDYNGDGIPNAADYTVWRDTLNSTSDLRADGDGSGTIDAADYELWKQSFETLLPGGLRNGDFETGDLENWESFVTEGGTVSLGHPLVSSLDVTGDGTASPAMRIRVGAADPEFGDPAEGGGIRQEFLLTELGDYEISADIASTNEQEFANTGPGRYELLLNSVLIDVVDLNGTRIEGNEVLRDSLSGIASGLEPGLHTLEIRYLRTATNTRPVYGHVDNISVVLVAGELASVPEPAALLLLGMGVMGYVQHSRRRR